MQKAAHCTTLHRVLRTGAFRFVCSVQQEKIHLISETLARKQKKNSVSEYFLGKADINSPEIHIFHFTVWKVAEKKPSSVCFIFEMVFYIVTYTSSSVHMRSKHRLCIICVCATSVKP